MAKVWLRKWKIDSYSGNKSYTVAVDERAEYGCSCPQWIYRRQECKHIQAVKRYVASKLEAGRMHIAEV